LHLFVIHPSSMVFGDPRTGKHFDCISLVEH
jgi:hypothetical protein